MKKLLVLSAMFACTTFITGCCIPTKGTSTSAITIDHIASDPVIDNNVRPVKRGEAKATAILIFNTGDASIGTAMRNGGITKLNHVDYDVKNILFLYNEVTTIVYGE